MSLAADLERDADAIATEVLVRMTTTRPELFERYGEVGKVRCHEDTRFHVLHLAAAIDAGDEEEFTGYVRWLTELLVPRGVPIEDIDANFSTLAGVLRDRYGAGAEEATALLADAAPEGRSGPG